MSELPVCFVVMGFHKKPALDRDKKVRILDLDKSYEALIKPAVEAANMRCVRADEVQSSGLIDRPMYEMLLSADLVVADISSGNVNAVYELGVRHALRPYRTILLLEDRAEFSFDLSHLSTFTYRHLGEDLPATQAAEKRAELTALIRQVNAREEVDSPVYEHLKTLPVRKVSPEDRARMRAVIETEKDQLARLISGARSSVQRGAFTAAIDSLNGAIDLIEALDPEERDQNKAIYEFALQQLALATYKSGHPDKAAALNSALAIIDRLHPDESSDTETVGIAGAIRKRLWDETRQAAHLEKAVDYYGRGFALAHDYYNGENYAACLVQRAAQQTDPDEKAYDLMTAKKTRKEIVQILSTELAERGGFEGHDALWRYATMANCLFALGRDAEAEPHERIFLQLAQAEWQRETYQAGKARLIAERG